MSEPLIRRRLLQAAPDITFSYSQADGNRMLRPSPLLAGIGGAVRPLAAAVCFAFSALNVNALLLAGMT